MKILIIGGNRFVGKLVTKELYSQGHDISVLNRTGTSPVLCNILKCDRNNLIEFQKVIGDVMFDCVIDMCLYNIEQAKISTKVLAHRTRKYIFISSIAAYTSFDIWPINEDHELGGMNCFGKYGVEKAKVEHYLMDFPNFPYITLRPTYVIGKNNHNYREKYYFDQMIDNNPIDVGPEGDKIVSFVFVEDLANIICAIATLDSLVQHVYNITGDEHVTIKKFINMISNITDRLYSIQEIKLPGKFENTHLLFDNSKIKKQLNFEFKSLTKGLTEFYEYTY